MGILLRKRNFRRKMRILKQSHSGEKSERRPFELFETPVYCKISKNLKGNKKIQNVTVLKKIDRGTLQTRPVLQIHEKVSG